MWLYGFRAGTSVHGGQCNIATIPDFKPSPWTVKSRTEGLRLREKRQHTCKMSDLHTTHHLRLSINCGAPPVKHRDAALLLVQLEVWGRDESECLALIGQGPRGSRKFWITQVHKLARKPEKRLRFLK